jgi:competence protein ComEA
MQDARVRLVIIALVIALAIGTGATWLSGRRTPPPVLITGAAPASPNPAEGDPGDKALPASTPAPAAPPSTSTSSTAASSSTDQPSTDLLYVHVTGAVKHPDIYTLKPGSRVVNAIKAAGGAKSDADLDAVNLAEKVVDGEKIYLPHKGEVSAPIAAPGNTIGLESSTPSPSGEQSASSAPTSSGPAGRGRGAGHGSNKLTDPSQGHVNLNTASAEQLERLPGVGPATAARIIEYRKENGGFKKPDDLMDVSGIGEKKMAKIAPFVVVR